MACGSWMLEKNARFSVVVRMCLHTYPDGAPVRCRVLQSLDRRDRCILQLHLDDHMVPVLSQVRCIQAVLLDHVGVAGGPREHGGAAAIRFARIYSGHSAGVRRRVLE